MRKGLVVAGLLVLGTGFYIVLMTIGVFPATGALGPRWILALAGMAFVLGGGLVSIGELINHENARELRDFELARAFRNVMIGILSIIFTVLGNWVAFGPGSRPVKSFLGLPLVDISAQVSEWVGRFGFGIGAILLDILLLGLIYASLNNIRRTQRNRE